jgi:hypothetical protein
MIAAPVIPGRVYRVTHRGLSFIVDAPDACTAIVIGIARFFSEEDMPCAA